ncbi:TadE/TadG family type IV pilus assembly protein [Alterisphingorhabdus coralli]|uniref:TadE/TadG family type IV pilus assembly protein n=1 Tax=Alterisphingorhabdus coralli TaxID=3071408 RepID=A0AA97F4C7_9SPHN|nr:TadE/TadG family type IV pilus assembly protein [Parasphingorhabdus sp. SCSIO 66989]WOE74079.1 TadE/TadG family type IV pilus assembly protein [Parasphingorhabdus sp. SCSIO 66989]
MMPGFSLLHRLKGCRKGATLIEFAIIAPTFLLLLMGAFDIGYSVFLRATLAGSVAEAARSSTLETAPGSVNAIDAEVTSQMQNINNSAQLTFERTSYYDFADIARPEVIVTDDNSDGFCDPGETFDDENGNGNWDADLGEAGIGGPRDIVLYRVTMTYPRIFPLYGLLGISQTGQMVHESVLRNQPYGQQDIPPEVSRETC